MICIIILHLTRRHCRINQSADWTIRSWISRPTTRDSNANLRILRDYLGVGIYSTWHATTRLLRECYKIIYALSDAVLSIGRMCYYSLVVFHWCSPVAVRSGLTRRLIEAMRIAVVAPDPLGPQLFRHFQSILHKYSAELFEATLRFLFHGCVAPKKMILAFYFYRQSLVRLEGGPILSEDRPPAFKVYHADTAKRFVGDLLDQVLPKYLEMCFQVTLLGNAAVSLYYSSWKVQIA